MAKRIYIDVVAAFGADGRILPLSIRWKDRRYEIDRVLDVRPSSALKAGGCGTRYTCRISGKERYLFLDWENRWFVEARD